MIETLKLTGPWKLTGLPPDGGEKLALPGAVPGHVHLDLLRAGRIPDPFWRDQAEACQWVEQWDWVYERAFTLEPGWENSWAVLEFEGLDTYATIVLNDREIGRTANMFVPHRFEVGKYLKKGRNKLRVHFDGIWKHVTGKPPEHECAFGASERIYVRRMQCTFHWDWVNRFVSYGIWRPVRLVRYDRARIADAHVRILGLLRPGKTEAAGADVVVRIETERRTGGAIHAAVEIFGPSGGSPVWTASGELRADSTAWRVRLDSPRLWWPNGYGQQPLYRCRCELRARNGGVLDSREVRFGVRTVEIEQAEDAPGGAEEARTRELRKLHPNLEAGNGEAPGRSFIVRVNGERIFCRGGNWVPADPWPSRVTGAWYKRLLGLAREGNVNCLRGWGGGIYEPEAFWDCCDRLGILVCQDFLMACARYPAGDAAFMAALREEIPAAIRMLRNHPSLAWWSGDNENGMDFGEGDPHWWGQAFQETIIEPALRELDPGRPFFPTSPFGGRRNTCMTIGDTHMSALPMDRQGLARDWREYRDWIARAVGRFNSESGTMGAPPMASLRRFMTAEDIADPASPIWYFHTKDNPYNDTRLYDAQRAAAEKLFGSTEDPARRAQQLEMIQHEWVRHSMEAARRWKWYNAGLLYWMFNDCWPATGWSVVDYYGVPKAGWYALKRACRPVVASIEKREDAHRVWVCNDTLAAVKGSLALRVQPWAGAARWERTISFAVSPNTSAVVGELFRTDLPALGLDAVLVAELKAGPHVDRAWYFEGLPGEMDPPAVALKARRERGKGRRRAVVIRAESYARVVTLAGASCFSDNYFDMLPGEERRIEWVAPQADGEPVSVRCWNEAGNMKETHDE